MLAEFKNCDGRFGLRRRFFVGCAISEASRSAAVKPCLFGYTITQERVEIQTRALKPDGSSQQARLLFKISPLAQFLKVVLMKF